MKKISKVLVLCLTLILALGVVAGCDKDTPVTPGGGSGNKKPTYTVSFMSDGVVASTVDVKGSLVAGVGSKINPPVISKTKLLLNKLKEGFIFINWYKDETFENVFDFSVDTISKKTSLYAKWVSKDDCAIVDDRFDFINKYDPTNPDAVFDANAIDIYKTKIALPKDTSSFDFNTLAISAGATLLVFSDSGFSKTVSNLQATPIESGINNFYLKITTADSSVTHKIILQIERMPIYAVRFLSGTSLISTIECETGSLITAPSVSRKGYRLTNWSYASSDGSGQSYKNWDFSKDTVTKSVTLYAEWEAEKYTVDLDLSDPNIKKYEGNRKLKVTYDTAPNGLDILLMVGGNLVVPEHNFGTFAGWFYNETMVFDAKGKGVISWNIDKDVTLTPKWEYKKYMVSVIASAGGSVEGGREASYLESVSVTAKPEVGYKFLGWKNTADSQGAFLSTELVYTFKMEKPSARSLTAYFEIFSTTLTFDLNYPSAPTAATKRVNYGDAIALGAVPTTVNSRFVGWSLDANDATKVITNNQGAPIISELTPFWTDGLWTMNNSLSTLTLYAIWEENVYALRVLNSNSNAGTIPTIAGDKVVASTVSYLGKDLVGQQGIYALNTVVNVGNPVQKPGHQFLKWVNINSTNGEELIDLPAFSTDGSTPFVSGDVVLSQDIFLVAVWKYEKITVTMNGDELSTVEVDYGQAFKLPVPSKPHYTFGGWVYQSQKVTDSNGASVVTLTTNTTLDATWIPVKYKINVTVLDKVGGTTNLPEEKEYSYGEIVNAIATPLSGYKFVSWYNVDEKGNLTVPTSGLSADGATYTVAFSSNIKICAKFVPESYTITFDTTTFNSAGLSIDPRTVTFGQTNFSIGLTLTSLNHTSNDGQYEFVGWYIAYNGKDVDISGADGICVKPWEFANDVTLKAKWKSIFTVDGGMITAISSYGANLETIIIPNICDGINIHGIGNNVFGYNKKLKHIVIDSNIDSIGENAFANCSNLLTVTFKDNSRLEIVGKNAFLNCSSIKKLAFPRNAVKLTEGCLSGCSGLTEMSLLGTIELTKLFGNENNAVGMVKVEHGSGKYYYAPSGLATIIIDDASTFVCDNAYANCAMIKNITLPASVKALGNNAFKGCINLTALDLTNITSIGYYALANSGIATTGILKLTSMGAGAFSSCAKLTSANLSNSELEIIPDNAFKDCALLATITLSSVKRATSIGAYSFYGCKALASINGDGLSNVLRIGNYAFNGSGLTNTDGFTGISIVGAEAFHGTPWFNVASSTILYVGVNRIAYYFSTGALPALDTAVVGIADNAFANSAITGVVDLSACASLLNIGEQAFMGSGITSVTIPASVTNVSRSAFKGCKSLATVNSNAKALSELVFEGCAALNSLTLTNTISIGQSAFFGCTSLAQVKLPDVLKDLGESAFENCTSLISAIFVDNSTFNVTTDGKLNKEFTDLIRVIKANTFKNTKLATIALPFFITEIEKSAFEGSKLTSITFMASTTEDLLKSQLQTIGSNVFKDCSLLTTITLGSSVKTLGSSAFENCSSLTELAIPGIAILSDSVFKNCSKLQKIGLSTSLTAIGNSAFENCYVLPSVAIAASVTKIGDKAFNNCYGLSQVGIPVASVIASIGAEAFARTAITSINLPNGVKTIATGTFEGCTKLNTVSISASSMLETIETSAFSGCASLLKITLPVKLRTIYSHAFENCTSLTNVEIPSYVESIGSSAFANCTSLTSVTFIGANPPTIGTGIFASCANNLVIYVKKEYAAAYRAQDGWSGITITEI
ncbi:MAG: leucine-rich repeat protein [Clostridia bacterium]